MPASNVSLGWQDKMGPSIYGGGGGGGNIQPAAQGTGAGNVQNPQSPGSQNQGMDMMKMLFTMQ